MSTLGYAWEAVYGFTSDYLMLLVLIGLPVAISRDMRRRGRTGWAYGLLILTVFPLGIVSWLIDRRRYALTR